jgi:hypothetical protein
MCVSKNSSKYNITKDVNSFVNDTMYPNLLKNYPKLGESFPKKIRHAQYYVATRHYMDPKINRKMRLYGITNDKMVQLLVDNYSKFGRMYDDTWLLLMLRIEFPYILQDYMTYIKNRSLTSSYL